MDKRIKRLLCIACVLFAAVMAVVYIRPGITERGGDSSIRIDLNDFPVYIKSGFDPADLTRIPEAGEWETVAGAGRRNSLGVMNVLPSTAKRRFLSPFD
jgi:hypothetical protein